MMRDGVIFRLAPRRATIEDSYAAFERAWARLMAEASGKLPIALLEYEDRGYILKSATPMKTAPDETNKMDAA